MTGNLEQTAKIKLRTVNLDTEKFLVGGFGSDSEDRNHLPKIARERAATIFEGYEFHDSHVFVIGVHITPSLLFSTHTHHNRILPKTSNAQRPMDSSRSQ